VTASLEGFPARRPAMRPARFLAMLLAGRDVLALATAPPAMLATASPITRGTAGITRQLAPRNNDAFRIATVSPLHRRMVLMAEVSRLRADLT
jgi:hypothetical protein